MCFQIVFLRHDEKLFDCSVYFFSRCIEEYGGADDVVIHFGEREHEYYSLYIMLVVLLSGTSN